MAALQAGLELLNHHRLWFVFDRTRRHLRSAASAALRSDTPNVTLDQETNRVHHEYFVNAADLMPAIGRFLVADGGRVLNCADVMDASR
jgi:hypothetical protein